MFNLKGKRGDRIKCSCGKKYRGGDNIIGVTAIGGKVQKWWRCQKCKTSYLVVRDAREGEKLWN